MAVVVAYTSGSAGEDDWSFGRSACYSVETDASGARFIRQTTEDGSKLYPAWSRDGRRLVLLDSSGESPRLFVYNYDGTGKRMTPLPSETRTEPDAKAVTKP